MIRQTPRQGFPSAKPPPHRSLVALLLPLFVVVAVAAGCPNEVPTPGCKGATCKTDETPAEAPRLFVDPPFGLGYDCVTIGCDVERRLVVENRGGGTIKLAVVRLSVDTSTDFQLRRGDDGALPFDEDSVVEIDADHPLELFVRYAPGDGVDDEGSVLIDWYDGKLAFEDAVLTHATLPLSTRALGDVAATVVGAQRLNFGFVPVGAYGVKDIVIANNGNGGVLAVGPVTLADGTPVVFDEGRAGAFAQQFVNPGEELRIPVLFRPNGPGVFEGSLFVVTNDGANPALEVALAGTAVEESRADVSVGGLALAGPIDFGTIRVGTTRNVDFRVQNQGGTPMVVQVAASGAGLSVFPPEPQTVAPLESAAFTAVWSPVSGGAFAGQLVVNSNDPANPVVVVDATGFADAPSLAVSPAAVDFGGVVQGWTTGAQTFLLSNNGFGDLTINTIAFDVGSSSQIRFAAVPPLPAKLSPNDPPLEVSVFLEASTLGTTNAVVLVGSDSIDNDLGASGTARLNVFGRVITCDEGCPVNHGTPSCGTGACEIGGCDSRFHDADVSFGSGCECGEDLVPGGGGTRRDVNGTCGGENIGPLGDDCASTKEVRRSGTLHDDSDVDLYFFRATDDASFPFGCDAFSDSFGVRIRFDTAPSGMQLCARLAEDGVGCGGENQRTCVPSGGSIFFDGNTQPFGDDDDADVTVWVEWAPGAAPQCGSYTLFAKANDG
jgi:hypothetical protein